MGKELKFYLITDTHHYALKSLGWSEGKDQKCINETGAIIDAVFDKFIAQDEVNIVLISGDLSNNGETASHLEFIEKLNRLKSSGKRVFVITATHDYGLRELTNGDNTQTKKAITIRSELRGLYNDFGFEEAIAEYTDNLSYVAQLAPGFRLLALNDDGDGKTFCGYNEAQLTWILEQIKSAQDAGEYIFAMTHHPVLPPSPIYPLMSKRDMLGDYENTSTILADAGLNFVFTGHTHMQHIGLKTTEKGNKLWDINTGSLVGYPTPIRHVVLDEEKMTITTEKIDTFDWDFKGISMEQYLIGNFDSLLNDIFDSMAFDFERFVGLAGSFSLEREKAVKLKIPIKLAGKVMQKLTLGKAGRLLFVSRKIDKSVKNTLVKDLVIECVRNIFSGEQPYCPGTPMYAAIMALLGRLKRSARHFGKDNEILSDLPTFVESIICDGKPNSNAVLYYKR